MSLNVFIDAIVIRSSLSLPNLEAFYKTQLHCLNMRLLFILISMTVSQFC